MAELFFLLIVWLGFKLTSSFERSKKELAEERSKRRNNIAVAMYAKYFKAKKEYERNKPYTDPDTEIEYKGRELAEYITDIKQKAWEMQIGITKI